MNQWLEKVIHGNPTSEQLALIQTATPYDYLLPKFFEVIAPSNISTLAHDELDTLVEYQKQYNLLPKSTKARYTAYESNLVQSVANYIYNRHNGYDLSALFEEIIQDTEPMLLKLKYKYQRPRPHVLAAYLKKSVFPDSTANSKSPSLPTGHVFFMTLLTETLGSIEPTMFDDLSKLLIDISEQRLFYRLNYPSDNDIAMDFARRITHSKEWTHKYNI